MLKANQLRPPQVQGNVYKLGCSTLIKHNKRYLVLDPKADNLYRYRRQEHYPLKFIEIISLRDIVEVRRVYHKFYMRARYHYFEIITTKKHIYCTKFAKTADQWVEFIIRAIAFINFVDKHVTHLNLKQIIYQQKQ